MSGANFGWGIVLTIYIVAMGLYVVSEEQTINAREGLYPKHEFEEWKKSRPSVQVLFVIGLFMLLGGYHFEAFPETAALSVASMLLMYFLGRKLIIKTGVMQKREFRIWLVASITWGMVSGAIYLIASALSLVYGNEFFAYIYLAVLPPVIAGISFMAFRWAKKLH